MGKKLFFYLFLSLILGINLCYGSKAINADIHDMEKKSNLVSSKENNKEYVVLLHGIARTSRSMKKLEKHFESKGYRVINVNYPSSKYPLDQLVDFVHQVIQSEYKDNAKIHFVGYSMGNLLIRGYLQKYRPSNLGRVVMIAPPNQGSKVADFHKNNFLYKLIFGPAGQQLITTQESIKFLLGEVNYELGVIAGDRTLDFFSSFILGETNDGKVTVESTKLEGMHDHIIVHATHTFIMKNKEVIKQTQYFIDHGMFYR